MADKQKLGKLLSERKKYLQQAINKSSQKEGIEDIARKTVNEQN